MRKQQTGASGGPLLLTLGAFGLILCYAVSITMLGPMMPHMIEAYDLGLARGGLFMSLQSAGGMLAILLATLGVDRVHKARLLALLFAAYTVSLHAIGSAPPYPVLLGLFALLGASTSVLDAVSTAFVADLHPDRRDVRLSQLHTFFALGALLGPLMTRLLLDLGLSWNGVYSALGYICLLVLAPFTLSIRSAPRRSPADGGMGGNLRGILAIVVGSRMWVLCSIAFCYLCQAGLVVWLPMYMQTHLSSSALLGSVSLSALWVGIIAGRWGYSLLRPYVSVFAALRWGSALGGLVLSVGFLLQSPGLLFAAVLIKGALTGPILPLILNIACSWFPARSGAVSCLIFLSGFAGTMLAPWLVGFAGEHLGLHVSMYFTALSVLAIFPLTLLLPRAEKSAARIR